MFNAVLTAMECKINYTNTKIYKASAENKNLQAYKPTTNNVQYPG